jgi:hypothetical protein
MLLAHLYRQPSFLWLKLNEHEALNFHTFQTLAQAYGVELKGYKITEARYLKTCKGWTVALMHPQQPHYVLFKVNQQRVNVIDPQGKQSTQSINTFFSCFTGYVLKVDQVNLKHKPYPPTLWDFHLKIILIFLSLGFMLTLILVGLLPHVVSIIYALLLALFGYLWIMQAHHRHRSLLMQIYHQHIVSRKHYEQWMHIVKDTYAIPLSHWSNWLGIMSLCIYFYLVNGFLFTMFLLYLLGITLADLLTRSSMRKLYMALSSSENRLSFPFHDLSMFNRLLKNVNTYTQLMTIGFIMTLLWTLALNGL